MADLKFHCVLRWLNLSLLAMLAVVFDADNGCYNVPCL